MEFGCRRLTNSRAIRPAFCLPILMSKNTRGRPVAELSVVVSHGAPHRTYAESRPWWGIGGMLYGEDIKGKELRIEDDAGL